MAGVSGNVRVGTTGQVFAAPTGTTLPTNATTAPHATFLAGEIGYVSDAGITQTIGAESTSIVAWQNADVVREIQTSHTVTFQFEMLETNSKTLAAFFGNYSASTVEVTGEQLGRQAWVIHVEDAGNDIRIVIPDGQITERGDIVYANAEAVRYPITITAYPVSDVKATIYYAGAGS